MWVRETIAFAWSLLTCVPRVAVRQECVLRACHNLEKASGLVRKFVPVFVPVGQYTWVAGAFVMGPLRFGKPEHQIPRERAAGAPSPEYDTASPWNSSGDQCARAQDREQRLRASSQARAVLARRLTAKA